MKTIKLNIEFSEQVPFSAYSAACAWLDERGFSYGSMSSPFPTAIKKGDIEIARWKNLTDRERADVDGVIEGEFREGPVSIKLYIEI